MTDADRLEKIINLANEVKEAKKATCSEAYIFVRESLLEMQWHLEKILNNK